jgi:hypothetical protein
MTIKKRGRPFGVKNKPKAVKRTQYLPLKSSLRHGKRKRMKSTTKNFARSYKKRWPSRMLRLNS